MDGNSITSSSRSAKRDRPLPIGLTCAQFYIDALGSHEEVRLQGLESSIMLELEAAIVGLGGWGENFNDHNGVEQSRARFTEKLGTARDHYVGIRVQPSGAYSHAHIALVDVRTDLLQLETQASRDMLLRSGCVPAVAPAMANISPR